MNKQCFRFVFSKILQRLFVTLKLAKSTDKSNKSESASGSILQKICKFRPLVLSLLFLPNIGNTQDSNPTQVAAKELGINTQIDNASQQVNKPKDVDKVLEEQNVLRDAMAQVSKAADTYSRRQADSLNQEADELAKQGKEQEATQKRREAESWQPNGSHSDGSCLAICKTKRLRTSLKKAK